MNNMANRIRKAMMLLQNNLYPFDTRVRQEAETLVAAGYRVTVISPKGRSQSRRETVNGVRVYRFPPPPPGAGFWGYLLEFAWSIPLIWLFSLLVLAREGADVVHLHNPPDFLVVIALLYKLLGKKFVYDHHDLSPELYLSKFGEHKGLLYKLLLLMERLCCSLADRIIATNESYRQVEMTRHQVQPDKISIVRNGPRPERFHLVAPDPALRAKANTIIGYVGNMAAQDGVDYLLRALHQLVYDLGRQDLYCVIIGKSDRPDLLRQVADEAKVSDFVWFTGRIPDEDLLRYLSTADICVDPDPSNPLNDKSTMIKVLEYMALGKPVVAYALPETRFSAGEAALYAQPNDELDFARQIARLMDDEALRRKMGQHGRERIERELAWQHSAANLLRAYESL
jgi:glycosyltransferase involved in cell wall biosynthesis